MGGIGARRKVGKVKNLDLTNKDVQSEMPCLEWLDYQIEQSEEQLRQMRLLREWL